MPMLYRYCPYCRQRLLPRLLEDGHRRLYCPDCGFVHYRNPTPAVGVIALEAGRILLVKRKYPPRAGLWSLPAGFMEYGEDPRQCAVREAYEETGLRIVPGPLVGVYSGEDDPRTHAILIVYQASSFRGRGRPGDDASDLGWFALGRLPPLAFRAHSRAIRDCLRNLSKP